MFQITDPSTWIILLVILGGQWLRRMAKKKLED